MSFEVYRVHRVLDIDDTCEPDSTDFETEIENYEKSISQTDNEHAKRSFTKVKERLMKKKNSKRPLGPIDRETDEPIEHPAYYVQVPKNATGDLKNICYNAKTMNDLGKHMSLLEYDGSKRIQNPPHHDFVKLQERLWESVKKGDAKELHFLLKMGANVNQANEYGNTPLSFAAHQCHEAVVRALLAAGANVNQANKRGNTPLFVAAEHGHEPVVIALLAAGANVNQANEDGDTPLIYAAEKGHEPVVRALLLAAGANVNQANEKGLTALIFATQRGHEAVVKVLLAAKANVNHASKDGNTPLIFAADRGHEAVVGALLAAGANVNQASKTGNTPLFVAAEKGHEPVVRALMAAGADVTYFPPH